MPSPALSGEGHTYLQSLEYHCPLSEQPQHGTPELEFSCSLRSTRCMDDLYNRNKRLYESTAQNLS